MQYAEGLQQGPGVKRAVAPNDFGEQYGDEPYVMLIIGSKGYINVHSLTSYGATRAREKGVPLLTSIVARGIIAYGKAVKR